MFDWFKSLFKKKPKEQSKPDFIDREFSRYHPPIRSTAQVKPAVAARDQRARSVDDDPLLNPISPLYIFRDSPPRDPAPVEQCRWEPSYCDSSSSSSGSYSSSDSSSSSSCD